MAKNQIGDESCNEEFNKLKQEGFVMDYQVRFEELKSSDVQFPSDLE